MLNAYRQALCTIAASDSKNSSGGLFHDLFYDRSYSGVQPYTLSIPHPEEHPAIATATKSFAGSNRADTSRVAFQPPEGSEGGLIRGCPLAARAWTLQDCSLSIRVLRFT